MACPAGYSLDATATTFTLCKRGNDELVKVGDFWIDRYEMSIVDATSYNSGKCDGLWTQFGTKAKDDYGTTFPDNAKATVLRYACSRGGVVPSAMMTWFQASLACRNAGKHLCSNDQWQVASLGTSNGGSCVGLTTCGGKQKCISSFGAVDMVGNLAEWGDWGGQAGKRWMTAAGGKGLPWKSQQYGIDKVWNVDGRAAGSSGFTDNLPFAAQRGGAHSQGGDAGEFFINLGAGPDSWGTTVGARCCIK